MKTKILALDIYGTILCIDDPENNMPVRKGFEDLVEKCNKHKIKIVSSSDANPELIKIDLAESGVKLDIFKHFYYLTTSVKDFSKILKDYRIKPKELFVIGDSDKDILGAINVGANYFRVPVYCISKDNFDLSKIFF